VKVLVNIKMFGIMNSNHFIAEFVIVFFALSSMEQQET